jgi:Zn-dependent M28 family amino/carboxypeptidase
MEISPSNRAERWWDDIKVLADDKMQGRLTGSPGYMRAAEVVIERFHAEGLTPAGDHGGFTQDVAYETQTVDQGASEASLVGPDGQKKAIRVGETLLISAGGAPRPTSISAPLIFVGYGLHLPSQGYDDFKGLDLKGKIAVVISGGPADLPGPMKAAARNARAKFLAESGAVGLISLVTPAQVEIPWARQKLLAPQPGMYLADGELRETPDGLFLASYDPAQSQDLFAGAPSSFQDLAALADASRPLPTFDLPLKLTATVAVSHGHVTSPNLIAKLEGSERRLRGQYVVISAHLDHLGVGAPIKGDPIYNGAMDDASGVASVLDVAHRLRQGPRPRRSILFVIVAGEEKGLLGSHYFAMRPTVPRGSIVADLNFDMPLPLWPLKSVLAQGETESSLGSTARLVAEMQGLTMVPDPLPDRNTFVRTDQFSFVKAGIPALAFKFGFAKDTPQFQIEHEWRANRYHAPSDDVNQPGVYPAEAVKLDNFVAAIAVRVANRTARPYWLETSVFKPTR